LASRDYEVRNARAVAEGYKSDYDRRVHGYGTIAPGVPVTSEMREAGRGHRSLADLNSLLGTGRAEYVSPTGIERGADGTFKTIHVAVFTRDGRQHDFYLRGRQASEANLKRLRSTLDDGGIEYLDAPSLDVFSAAA
jgi:hypothetical protein